MGGWRVIVVQNIRRHVETARVVSMVQNTCGHVEMQGWVGVVVQAVVLKGEGVLWWGFITPAIPLK